MRTSSRWTMPGPSTPTAGCSSRTAWCPRSARARSRVPTNGSTSRARSSLPASSTRTITSSRRSPAPRTGGRPLHLASRALSRSGRGSTRGPSTRRPAPVSPSSLLSGCTTVFDHHYVFPRGGAECSRRRSGSPRARRPSRRFAGLDGPRRLRRRASRPTTSSRSSTTILADTERVVDELHERGPGARIQIAVAPCSPFSVTRRLMEESAALARARDSRSTRISPRRSRRTPTAMSCTAARRSST